jgi:hypothetical protein
MSLIDDKSDMNEIIKLKKEIRKLKREIKILKEGIILEELGQDMCDRISEALLGHRRSGESLDEAVIRLLNSKKKV